MAASTKARRKREPESTVEIRVRLNSGTKDKTEKFFQRYGMSISDGVRLLISQALHTGDIPHIPNEETCRALEADVMPMPAGGLAQLWREEIPHTPNAETEHALHEENLMDISLSELGNLILADT